MVSYIMSAEANETKRYEEAAAAASTSRSEREWAVLLLLLLFPHSLRYVRLRCICVHERVLCSNVFDNSLLSYGQG